MAGKKKEPINILQYADDTIFVGEAEWENVIVLKAMLRGFWVSFCFLISVADYFGDFDDWFSIICASIIHYLRFSVSFKIWPQENILRMMGILCTDG